MQKKTQKISGNPYFDLNFRPQERGYRSPFFGWRGWFPFFKTRTGLGPWKPWFQPPLQNLKVKNWNWNIKKTLNVWKFHWVVKFPTPPPITIPRWYKMSSLKCKRIENTRFSVRRGGPFWVRIYNFIWLTTWPRYFKDPKPKIQDLILKGAKNRENHFIVIISSSSSFWRI